MTVDEAARWADLEIKKEHVQQAIDALNKALRDFNPKDYEQRNPASLSFNREAFSIVATPTLQYVRQTPWGDMEYWDALPNGSGYVVGDIISLMDDRRYTWDGSSWIG